MPDAISPVSPTTPAITPTTTAAINKTDQDMFLKLLVAQLKYQDVSSPMDPSEMMSQMAQLTTVDKLTALVQGQESGAATDRLALAASLVGRQVTWTDTTGEHSDTVKQVRLSGSDLLLTVGTSEIDATSVTVVR